MSDDIMRHNMALPHVIYLSIKYYMSATISFSFFQKLCKYDFYDFHRFHVHDKASIVAVMYVGCVYENKWFEMKCYPSSLITQGK